MAYSISSFILCVPCNMLSPVIPFLFGDVDFDKIAVDIERAVHFDSLNEVLEVLELHIAEALELVRLSVHHQPHIFDVQIL